LFWPGREPQVVSAHLQYINACVRAVGSTNLFCPCPLRWTGLERVNGWYMMMDASPDWTTCASLYVVSSWPRGPRFPRVYTEEKRNDYMIVSFLIFLLASEFLYLASEAGVKSDRRGRSCTARRQTYGMPDDPDPGPTTRSKSWRQWRVPAGQLWACPCAGTTSTSWMY